MSYDWRKPIPRTALTVIHPETGEVILQRPPSDAGKQMTQKQYQAVEAVRAEWAKAQQVIDRQKEAERQAEIAELRARKMGRDSLEETAYLVHKRLESWYPYVDTERWVQLLEWLDSHPQRISESDEQLIALDGRLKALEGIPISLIELRPHRGRPKGTAHSPESNAKRSASMRKKWKEWHKEGSWPAVGAPPRSRPPEDEAPY
jgi:predicted RecB family endonuclease